MTRVLSSPNSLLFEVIDDDCSRLLRLPLQILEAMERDGNGGVPSCLAGHGYHYFGRLGWALGVCPDDNVSKMLKQL